MKPSYLSDALIHWALVADGSIIGRVAPLSFDFLAGLVAGPGAILFGVIPLFKGHGSGPCVPPRAFDLFRTMSRECVDNEFNL
jgi:hypothetical protein